MKKPRPFTRLIQPRRQKIGIVIPCTGTLRIETYMSILGIIFNTPHDFYFAYRDSCYVQQNRWRLAQMAIEQKCEKIFFVDADMIIPADALNKLLALNKPIAGANYNKRTIPVTSNIKMADADGTLLNVPAEEIPAEPFKCYAVPTGCMLVDVQAMKKIPQPWFDVEMDTDGSLLTGEDVFFCREAQKVGLEVWCDPTIQVGHIGTFVY